MKYKDLRIGQTAQLSKTFCFEDVLRFSELSLDTNPIHLDSEYAECTIFKSRLVHGFLSSSLISGVIGTILPGPGSIYLQQDLNFRKPVYQGQTITAVVTLIEKREDKSIVKLSTICKNELGEVVIDGSAIIKLLE